MTSSRFLTSISLATLAIAVPTVAFAQAPAQDDQKDIVVTGSRVVGRSKLDSTAAVDVFSGASLQQQGTPQLATAIANIAPSIDFPRPSNTDGTDAIRPATLRGMSPDQTLVLINGERAHTSALLNLNGSVGRGSQAVDLNTIPTIALDGLEVLRDGASAQYGSDAIAGVVNLKLRKADHGGGANVSYGVYDTNYTGTYGKHSVTGEPTIDVSGWQGFKLGNDGFLTISGDYQHTSATNRADNDPRSNSYYPGTVDSRTGDPNVYQGSGFANFGKGLGGSWSMYGWLGYQYRNTTSNATLRTPGTNNYTAYNIDQIYPTGFIPQINTHSKDLNSALGVKGEVDGWSVDAKISYGMNKIDFWTRNSANYTYGAASQTNFYDGSLKYDQLVGGVDVAKKFDVLNGLNVAWGVEGRRETYSIGAGEPASYNTGTAFVNAAPGAQGFGGFKNTDAGNFHRSNVSAYVDLDQQVTEKLRLGAAGRFERYSDFGSTETFKASGRYDFSHAFALRGTISSGFRAPSLGQEYFTSTASSLSTTPITVTNPDGTSTTYPINTPVNTGTYASTSAVGKALGGQPLRPEKSINYSAGAVFRLGGLDLTVDGYLIKVRDALALSENIATSFSTQVADLLNPYGVSQARFFINGVHTTTQGIDAIAHYKHRTDKFGIFDLTLAGNVNRITVDSVPTSTSVLNPAPTLFARTRILTMSEGTPGEKVTGTVEWAKGKIGATARVTYYGNVIVPQTLASNDTSTGPRAITDLELRYQPTDTALNLAIGANNLFDVYPRNNTALVNTTGATPFPAYTPWGVNGRYMYVRASVKW